MGQICASHLENGTTGIANLAEGKERVNSISFKTRRFLTFCESDSPWRLVWLLDILLPRGAGMWQGLTVLDL